MEGGWEWMERKDDEGWWVDRCGASDAGIRERKKVRKRVQANEAV